MVLAGLCLVTQLCLTLCDPMDCSPPGSSVHGIFQARVLEWGAIAFSDMYARYTLIYIARLSLSDLFHSMQETLGSSTSLQLTQIHPFYG